jgi:hypothetical protein
MKMEEIASYGGNLPGARRTVRAARLTFGVFLSDIKLIALWKYELMTW